MLLWLLGLPLGSPSAFDPLSSLLSLFSMAHLTVTGLQCPSLGWSLGLGPHLAFVLTEDRVGSEDGTVCCHIWSCWGICHITIKATFDF